MKIKLKRVGLAVVTLAMLASGAVGCNNNCSTGASTQINCM